MWFWFALGSTVFAALTSILARGVHRQVPDRLYTDWRGDVGYGAVKD